MIAFRSFALTILCTLSYCAGTNGLAGADFRTTVSADIEFLKVQFTLNGVCLLEEKHDSLSKEYKRTERVLIECLELYMNPCCPPCQLVLRTGVNCKVELQQTITVSLNHFDSSSSDKFICELKRKRVKLSFI